MPPVFRAAFLCLFAKNMTFSAENMRFLIKKGLRERICLL